MKTLQGKVAVITGGNSGIGKATAKLFAEEGAQVIITARRQDLLDQAVQEIGFGAIGIQGDVADLAHHRAVAGTVAERFGAVDIYLANAGVIDLKPTDAISEEAYDRHFSINTKGVFFGVQAIAPIMNEQRVFRICLESPQGVRRRNCPGFHAVACQAGAAVASESFTFEKPLAVLTLAKAASLATNKTGRDGEKNQTCDQDAGSKSNHMHSSQIGVNGAVPVSGKASDR